MANTEFAPPAGGPPAPPAKAPLLSAGLLLGIGMGGFVDGIVFHQLLQTHSMLSGVRPGLTLAEAKANMFWDGMFHAFSWGITLVGCTGSGRPARRRARGGRGGPWRGP